MNYTQSNWTVSSKYTDTIQTAKNIAVPDLSYATDFKKSVNGVDEAIIKNVTGSEITPMETIRYGSSVVSNIYTGTNTEPSCMAPSKKGVQTLVEISEVYRAVNTVTGDEIELPCKGRIVLKFPTHSCVKAELVQDLLTRTIAAALNKGSVDASRELAIARGSLLPDGM